MEVLDMIEGWVQAGADGTSVLWLRGLADAGKSAIVQTMAEICARVNQLAASFFYAPTAAHRNEFKYPSTSFRPLPFSLPSQHRKNARDSTKSSTMVHSLLGGTWAPLTYWLFYPTIYTGTPSCFMRMGIHTGAGPRRPSPLDSLRAWSSSAGEELSTGLDPPGPILQQALDMFLVLDRQPAGDFLISVSSGCFLSCLTMTEPKWQVGGGLARVYALSQ